MWDGGNERRKFELTSKPAREQGHPGVCAAPAERIRRVSDIVADREGFERVTHVVET